MPDAHDSKDIEAKITALDETSEPRDDQTLIKDIEEKITALGKTLQSITIDDQTLIESVKTITIDLDETPVLLDYQTPIEGAEAIITDLDEEAPEPLDDQAPIEGDLDDLPEPLDDQAPIEDDLDDLPEPLDDRTAINDSVIKKAKDSRFVTQIGSLLHDSTRDDRRLFVQKQQVEKIIGTYLNDYKKLHADLIVNNENNPKYDPIAAASNIKKKDSNNQEQGIELDNAPHVISKTTLNNKAEELKTQLNDLATKFYAEPNADNLAAIEIAYRKANLETYKNYLSRKVEATIILKSLVNNENSQDKGNIADYKQKHRGFALLQRKLDLIEQIETSCGFTGQSALSSEERLDAYRTQHKQYASVFHKHCSWAEKGFIAKFLSCIFVLVAAYYAVTKSKSAFFTKSLGKEMEDVPLMRVKDKHNQRNSGR